MFEYIDTVMERLSCSTLKLFPRQLVGYTTLDKFSLDETFETFKNKQEIAYYDIFYKPDNSLCWIDVEGLDLGWSELSMSDKPLEQKIVEMKETLNKMVYQNYENKQLSQESMQNIYVYLFKDKDGTLLIYLLDLLAEQEFQKEVKECILDYDDLEVNNFCIMLGDREPYTECLEGDLN